jgi:alkyl sulfatase BDS1-like metallo-beta-lactamase superfamily hydrolase
MKHLPFLITALAALFLAGCDRQPDYPPGADENGHTAPTEATLAANRAVLEELDFSDRQDFEDARRGLIAADPDLRIRAETGRRS